MAEAHVDFHVNPSFEQEIESAAEYQSAVLGLADEAAQIARSLSPERSGRWRNSIVVMQDTAGIHVAANGRTWHWYEFGNYRMPASAPFRGACEQLGLELRG